jgi:hypothetical protein
MSNHPVKNHFSLFEITNEYVSAYEAMVGDPDLTDEDIKNTLDGLQGEIIKKSINVGVFIKNMESFVKQMEKAEQDIRERRRAMENRTEKLKEYLKNNMERCGIISINDSPLFSIRIKNCPPSVQIEEWATLPKEYINTKIIEEPDKRMLADALKNGGAIEGVKLVNKKTLLIK